MVLISCSQAVEVITQLATLQNLTECAEGTPPKAPNLGCVLMPDPDAFFDGTSSHISYDRSGMLLRLKEPASLLKVGRQEKPRLHLVPLVWLFSSQGL